MMKNKHFSRARKYFRYLTLCKLSCLLYDQVAFYASKAVKRGLLPVFPVTALVEPTNYCNLKCPLCPTGNGTLRRPRGFMDFSTYSAFIDQAGKYLISISFWNYGEPFLHKRLFEMIRKAHDARIHTVVSTNGHYLSAENIEKTLCSGLAKMILSIDGISQETLSQYRVGADAAKIFDGVKDLCNAKKNRNTGDPHVCFQFIVMRHNEHELQLAREKSVELGCDSFVAEYVHGDEDTVCDYLPDDEERRAYEEGGKLKKSFGYVCRRPWEHIVLNWNGDIAACCHDPENSIQLGNINQQSLRSIWQGLPYRGLRDALARGSLPPVCRSCKYY